jgi:signal transduction histidine kinase/CheY-like chemotaxis protein
VQRIWIQTPNHEEAPPVGPRTVMLPDVWAKQGYAQGGAARYHLPFHWSPSSEEERSGVWALRFQDISSEHRIRINGHLLSDRTTPRGQGSSMHTQWITFPPTLLQAGDNHIEVDVWHSIQGGLSAPSLAPKVDMKARHLWQDVFHRHALLAVNLASFSFSMFVLLLWWVRRQEVAAGLFGLLIGVAFARNCSYFITDDIGVPPEISSWLFFMAHVIMAVAQGWLVMHITGRHPAWLKKALTSVAVIAPAMSLLALPWDPALTQTRNVLQPILIGLLCPTLWLLWVSRKQFQMGGLMLALMIGAGLVLLSGLHDFVMLRLVGDISARNWLIWAIPTIMPAFSAMLLSRVAQAFDQLEHLNASLEQQVAERTHQLQQANLAKSRFLAAASHDLRQPVAAIGLMTELLRQQTQAPAQQALTNKLSAAVVSMEEQLNGLLDLSRLDAGDIVVRQQAVPLAPLLQSILAHVQEPAREKALSLRVRTGDTVAWCDPVLLEQVLRNLVGNAVRHTRTGGVLIAVRQRDTLLRIDVWDTGPGIAEADQQRVFDEFVQLPGNTAAGRGLGLGLAIARRAASLMGATLRLRSRPGRGSCFSLELPVVADTGTSALSAQALRSARLPSLELTPERGPTTAQKARRVLLVEDEAPLRQALSLTLVHWGWEVDAHASVEAAQTQAQGPWALVITDHHLPDGEGGDVLRWVRRVQPDIAAVVITGDTAPEQLRVLATLDAPVLHKPFRPEKLRAMIGETMALTSDDSV